MNRIFPWKATHHLFNVVLISICVGVFPSFAHADFKLCNRSEMPIYTAIKYNNGTMWITEGWWRLWPGDCKTPLRGNIDQKYYYVYANSSDDFFVWKGDSYGCVRDEPFTMNAHQCEPNSTKQFRTVDTGDAVLSDYEYSFTCSDCKLPQYRYDSSSKRITAYHVVDELIENTRVYVPIHGTFDLRLDNNANLIRVSARLDLDMAYVQRQFGSIASSAFNQEDDCGDNFSVNSVSLRPSGTSAEMGANATYAKWYCTYADLPQIKCEDTWIESDVLGFKTKGVPDCTTWVDTVQTSKNKLFQQSGSLTVSIAPSLANRYSIYLNPTVIQADLDGLGQTFANLLGVNMKNVAQNLLSGGLDPAQLTFAMPEELRDVTQLNEAHFEASNGDLHLAATGTFTIDTSAAIRLCRQFWSSGQCTKK
jgi:uncharacterized membrane protein